MTEKYGAGDLLEREPCMQDDIVFPDSLTERILEVQDTFDLTYEGGLAGVGIFLERVF